MKPVDDGVPAERSSSAGCLDALTAPDQGEVDITPAAEAVYWLAHPETPRRTSSFADLITQWENAPEWIPDPSQSQEPAPYELDDAQ